MRVHTQLEMRSEFSKVTGYKTGIKNVLYFLIPAMNIKIQNTVPSIVTEKENEISINLKMTCTGHVCQKL